MPKTLHGKFLEVSRACWNEKMSIDAHSGMELTYGHAAVAANLLSGVIKAKTKKKYVAILLPPCGGNLLALYGTLFSGKTPAMINYSTGVLSNIDIVKKKCNTDLILTSRKIIEKLGIEGTEEMLFVEEIFSGFSVFSKILSLAKIRFFPPCISDDETQTAVILFTSGSEKEPKAVQLTHRNVLSSVKGIMSALSASPGEHTLLGTLPLFHSFGFLASSVFVTERMKIIFYPNPLDYKTVGETAKKYSTTVMIGTPTFYDGYISKCPKDSFSSIKIAISGGDRLHEKTRKRFLEKFGVEIMQGYGITECSAGVTLNSPAQNRHNSTGKPLEGVEIKIIHRETGKEIPANQDGLILVKGDSVMPGYLGDEEKTKEVIKDSWYHTGDIGHLDEDGFLWFSGRVKRFVKVGGEMISLTMVEATLSECIPRDCECAVIGVDDEKRGSKIHAFITLQDKDSLPTVKAKLKEVLSPIAMPKVFHILEELPKLGSGKFNYRELNTKLTSP